MSGQGAFIPGKKSHFARFWLGGDVSIEIDSWKGRFLPWQMDMDGLKGRIWPTQNWMKQRNWAFHHSKKSAFATKTTPSGRTLYTMVYHFTKKVKLEMSVLSRGNPPHPPAGTPAGHPGRAAGDSRGAAALRGADAGGSHAEHQLCDGEAGRSWDLMLLGSAFGMWIPWVSNGKIGIVTAFGITCFFGAGARAAGALAAAPLRDPDAGRVHALLTVLTLPGERVCMRHRDPHAPTQRQQCQSRSQGFPSWNQR